MGYLSHANKLAFLRIKKKLKEKTNRVPKEFFNGFAHGLIGHNKKQP